MVLIPGGHARGKAIVGLRPVRSVKPNVLGPHRDLDRFTGLYVGRHQRREAMPAGVDDANSPSRSSTRP